MTTEPGLIPKEIDTVNFRYLPEKTRRIVIQIGKKMYNIQEAIKFDYNYNKKIDSIYHEEDCWTDELETAWKKAFKIVSNKMQNLPFNEDLSDKEAYLVRGSFYCAINRVSYEEFGKSLFNRLDITNPALLKMFSFGHEKLTTSKNYTNHVISVVQGLEKAAAWIDNEALDEYIKEI